MAFVVLAAAQAHQEGDLAASGRNAGLHLQRTKPEGYHLPGELLTLEIEWSTHSNVSQPLRANTHIAIRPTRESALLKGAVLQHCCHRHGQSRQLLEVRWKPLISSACRFDCQNSKIIANAMNACLRCRQVYEGEDACTKENVLLGTFELPIPPGPAGAPSVTVTMAVSEDGLLDVTALDTKTGELLLGVLLSLVSLSLSQKNLRRLCQRMGMGTAPPAVGGSTTLGVRRGCSCSRLPWPQVAVQSLQRLVSLSTFVDAREQLAVHPGLGPRSDAVRCSGRNDTFSNASTSSLHASAWHGCKELDPAMLHSASACSTG